ncbi:UNVERIFIED_CONTAM: hypothetical protein K2H54_057021 [Gekko kuhli]
MMYLIEGTIMLVTSLETSRQPSHSLTVHGHGKGAGEEACVEEAATPARERGRQALFFRTRISEVLLLNLQLNGFLLEHTWSLIEGCLHTQIGHSKQSRCPHHVTSYFFLAAFDKCQHKMSHIPISASEFIKIQVCLEPRVRGGGGRRASPIAQIALFVFPTARSRNRNT